MNNGRSSLIRSFNTVSERSQPIRSAITVAGILGHHPSNSQSCGSTASTIDPRPDRSNFGGSVEANARRTVFRPTPSRRTIALIAIPSAR